MLVLYIGQTAQLKGAGGLARPTHRNPLFIKDILGRKYRRERNAIWPVDKTASAKPVSHDEGNPTPSRHLEKHSRNFYSLQNRTTAMASPATCPFRARKKNNPARASEGEVREYRVGDTPSVHLAVSRPVCLDTESFRRGTLISGSGAFGGIGIVPGGDGDEDVDEDAEGAFEVV